MRGHNQIRLLFLGLLALVLPAWAQVKIGEDLSATMSGSIGGGYTGDYGNAQPSDHGFGVNGDANVSGYFYNPNFLNFFVMPVYNRSQENSGSQSITDATSVSAGAGIFGGSHFPGSVSYGRSFNSSGNYGLPGIPGFTTTGDSSHFGIGWSELVPGLPPLTAQYYQNSSSSTVLGSTQEENASARNFSLQTQYRLDGWWMTARFNDLTTHTELPSFLTAGEYATSDDNSKTFIFNTSHKLPMKGGFVAAYSYGSFNGEANGSTTSGSNDEFSGNASFIPWRKLTANFGVDYDTSLTGLVEQQLVSAGSVAPQVNFGSQSHSLSIYNGENLYIGKGLNVGFYFDRLQQEAHGESVAADHFSFIVSYNFHKPLWGAVNFYVGVNDQTTDAGHQGTGLVAGASFNKRMLGFDWSGSFNYGQDVQTVLATQVTSDYSYLASAKRHLSQHLLWNANFSGFHSGLSQIAGLSSHSEGYGTNLMYKGYSAGATYSTAYGTALVTANGLVPTPVTIAPVLSGNQYLLDNASSYTISVTANPVNRFSTTANYTKGLFNTTTPAGYTASSSSTFTVYTQYYFRKVSFNAGYSHLMQGVGTSTGSLPADFSSFFVGMQRWFKGF